MSYLFLFLFLWALVGSARLPKALGFLALVVVCGWTLHGCSWFMEFFPESWHGVVLIGIVFTLCGTGFVLLYWIARLSYSMPARKTYDRNRL